METTTRTLFLSASISSTVPMKLARGPSVILHGIAHVVQHHDLVLFHAQCSDLLLRQGDGFVGLSYEAGDATDVADQMPGVICQDHLNEDVTGEYLALHFLHDTPTR